MEFLDMMANLAGAVAGLYLYKYMSRKWAIERVIH
jgi:hypothetical protein